MGKLSGRDNRATVNLLAFDTSTETLFVGLAWTAGGQARTALHVSEGGRAASATLIPSVQAVLAQAGLGLSDLSAIAFGRGPGSFTGLRTACAVAQGLALGANLPVLPVDTLMALAEDARQRHGCTEVLAALDARMGEVYACAYRFELGLWHAQGEVSLGAPEALVLPPGFVLAGNVQAAYAGRLPAPALSAQPTAEALLRLAPALLAAGQSLPADQALPLYVRDKVAQTTAEREALKAAAATATATAATAPSPSTSTSTSTSPSSGPVASGLGATTGREPEAAGPTHAAEGPR
jgi:tRNA threonylcarbamoyladenosine biosynthesis protein TsaB